MAFNRQKDKKKTKKNGYTGNNSLRILPKRLRLVSLILSAISLSTMDNIGIDLDISGETIMLV